MAGEDPTPEPLDPEVDPQEPEEDPEPEAEPTDPEPEPEPEWTPPTKAEWEKHQKALKEASDKLSKVNKESTQRRLKIRELESQNEDEAAKAQREALEAAQARYKPVVAKSALLEAQARTDRVGALIKLLNMDSLEFDGNDEVVGLDLEVQRLRDEYPEFFTQPEEDKPEAPPAPRQAPKAAAAPKKPARHEPKTAGEIIAAQLLGN